MAFCFAGGKRVTALVFPANVHPETNAIVFFILFFLDVLLPPFSPPECAFKMTTNVSVHTLQATDGYCSGDTRLRLGVMVDFVFSGVGGDISYLKDQGTVMEQPNPSLRRMAAGSLWKNRLALPPPPPFFCFLLIDPHVQKNKTNLFLSLILYLTISSTCLILFVFCCLCHTKC